MKQCCRCKELKPVEAFGRNKQQKDGLQKYCKECGRASGRRHYLKNKQRKLAIREATHAARRRNMQFVFNYLQSHPCVDCGEDDPVVLEFDHLRDKYKTISKLITYACSLDRIFREIEKCEVRCANCHRRKTAEQFGWYKDCHRAPNGKGLVL